MLDRVPVAPHRKGERLLRKLSNDVDNMKRRGPGLTPDSQGRVRIGNIYLITTDTDDGSGAMVLTVQNAITLGPPITIGVLK